MVGRSQQIVIGPMSGKANVRRYLEERQIIPDAPLLAAILRRAKERRSVLSESDVLAVVASHDRHTRMGRRAG
jgi:hypothetical protein